MVIALVVMLVYMSVSCLGRVVATVATDRPVAAGSNTLLWNARSTHGTKVPPGRYLVKITAAAESGPQQQIIVPLWVSR